MLVVEYKVKSHEKSLFKPVRNNKNVTMLIDHIHVSGYILVAIHFAFMINELVSCGMPIWPLPEELRNAEERDNPYKTTTPPKQG